ncbi:hypothetical protein AVEN_147533-1 [Araneus ventricosus]|uniref:Uncharacterized protein n=1 Tax=Araneus ventricosus TaxID=182803 RepID=A0A4Y2AP07_ARAVE|nr:hypothetical protein AVEN_147533-1 [Araneus ventricosus]
MSFSCLTCPVLSYVWEKSFTGVNLGWPGLDPELGDEFGDHFGDLATNLATILATWRQIWLPRRQIDDSRKCDPFLNISIRRENTLECTRKFHVTSRRVYKGRVWIREESVDRLERLWSFVYSAR